MTIEDEFEPQYFGLTLENIQKHLDQEPLLSTVKKYFYKHFSSSNLNIVDATIKGTAQTICELMN